MVLAAFIRQTIFVAQMQQHITHRQQYKQVHGCFCLRGYQLQFRQCLHPMTATNKLAKQSSSIKDVLVNRPVGLQSAEDGNFRWLPSSV